MNHNDKLKIARQFKKQMMDLEHQQDEVFKKALKKLKLKHTDVTFEYFFNEDTDYYLDQMFGETVSDRQV
jgi:hypothetical protein